MWAGAGRCQAPGGNTPRPRWFADEATVKGAMDGRCRLSRRALIGAGLALAAAPAGAVRSGGGLAAAAPEVNRVLLARALDALARHDHALWSRDVVGIVDFGLPSAHPRFHLVDILAGTTTTLLGAHGKGSDPQHTGMLQRFSNVEGSMASSEGAYLIGDAYDGKHGPSRRLIGLDPTCDQAEPRAIVIHSAWYVGPEIVAQQGRLGRSDGCFAVSGGDIAMVLARLGRGRLLYAGRADTA